MSHIQTLYSWHDGKKETPWCLSPEWEKRKIKRELFRIYKSTGTKILPEIGWEPTPVVNPLSFWWKLKIKKRRWPFFSSISRLKYSKYMENKARKGIKSNPIGSRSYLYRLFRVIARVYFRGGFFACTCEKADDLNVIEKMEMSGPKVIKRPSGEYTSKRRGRWWWRDLDRRADIEAGAIDKVKKERSCLFDSGQQP